MNEQVPSKEIVHAYAGFPGKTLCLGTDTPIGTHSTTIWDQVTCTRCWIDRLIGDGKRDNIIVPMSIAKELQAVLGTAHEPPADTSPYNVLTCIREEVGPEIMDFLAAGTWCRIAEALLKQFRPAQPPPDVLKQISDARLDWSMVCPCTCSACTTFDSTLRSALTKEVR